jgi:integrase
MASVFKRRGPDGKKRDVWEYCYRDATGKRVWGVGWADKTKTINHANEVEAECRVVRRGERAAPTAALKNRNKPIAEIVAEYLKWGRVQGGRYGRPWDDQNSNLKEIYLEWWTTELGLKLLADIKLVNVEKALQRLIATGSKAKTAANRVEALRSLCLWSIRRGYLAENPLAGLAKFDTRPQEPHRPLTDDETAALLRTAPPERRLWYEAALGTGFRLNELRSLRCKDLDLFGPSLFLAADYSKDRKEHRQPITRELAEKLKALTAGRQSDDALLGIPRGGANRRCHRDAGAIIAADYRAANVAIKTPAGKATWHSLRKAFVNAVVRCGSDLKTVMTLARHSTAQLSMEVYASTDPIRLREATEAAAQHVQAAINRVGCCIDAAKKVAGGEGSIVTTSAANSLPRLRMVGDTGLEPVQPIGEMPDRQDISTLQAPTPKKDSQEKRDSAGHPAQEPTDSKANAGCCIDAAWSPLAVHLRQHALYLLEATA